ncbi:CLUMA_CG008795, isoform A [Clunio marinus]|uniref:CLUMA_CG008795, isoform A n=1 Tax=Clunio marinus TaxID=568069 RepID=A0A1J1I9U3_9DIPT|nr:CLUMA_CG008795, isoform A [Clunio marinus]
MSAKAINYHQMFMESRRGNSSFSSERAAVLSASKAGRKMKQQTVLSVFGTFYRMCRDLFFLLTCEIKYLSHRSTLNR